MEYHSAVCLPAKVGLAAIKLTKLTIWLPIARLLRLQQPETPANWGDWPAIYLLLVVNNIIVVGRPWN